MPRQAIRRITKARIKRISLVPRGANQLPVIYKSDEGSILFETVIKDDRIGDGYLTAVVYAPETADHQGDVASAEVIKDMAHEFGRGGLGGVDLVHNNKDLPKDQAAVVESFIIQKGDDRFSNMKDYDGNPIDVVGGWAVVIKIDDPELRRMYAEGKWNGVSMFGDAEVKAESGEGAVTKIMQALSKLLGASERSPEDNGEIDMKPEELKELLQGHATTLKAEVAKMIRTSKHSAEVLEKAGVKEDDTEEMADMKVRLYKAENKDATATTTAAKGETTTKPVFKGDVSKAEDVAAFDLEIKKWEITSKMDPSDPASIAEAHRQLAELAKEGDTQGDGTNPEVTRLRRELAKALGKSEQPTTTKLKLAKEKVESLDAAAEMAAIANNDHEKLAQIRKARTA